MDGIKLNANRTDALAMRPQLIPAVDMHVLDALMVQLGGADADLRDSLLSCYLDEASGQLLKLLEAAAEADVATVASLAHSLRSSSTLLGATGLADLLLRAEEEVRSGVLDLTALVATIHSEFGRVTADMTQLIGAPSPR